MFTTPVHVTSKNLDVLQIKRRVQRLAIQSSRESSEDGFFFDANSIRKAKKPKCLDDQLKNMALNNATVSGCTGMALKKELQRMLQFQVDYSS